MTARSREPLRSSVEMDSIFWRRAPKRSAFDTTKPTSWLWVLDFSLSLTWLLLFLTYPPHSEQASAFGKRTFVELSNNDILHLISSPDPVVNLDPSNPTSHLSKILIPRAPDTQNNTIVRKYIVSVLQGLGWHIEEDSFTDNTPVGPKRFTNVIATKDPSAHRRVILSAHFDSKYFPSYPMNQFLGATDAAASCAMLLDLAETINPLLDQRKSRLEEGLEDDEDVSETTLQLVFFDGEEAFGQWTDTNSVYGSRHLAEKWATSYIVPHTKRRLLSSYSDTEISTIEHLILLDLLGARNPSIRSFFIDTAWLFDEMASAERRLAENGALYEGNKTGILAGDSFFLPRTGHQVNLGYIGDDHAPFLHRGVSVLHLIASPFPRVWHTINDDATALDIPTMRRWNIILRVFMAEYLNLRPDPTRLYPAPRDSASSAKRSDNELINS